MMRHHVEGSPNHRLVLAKRKDIRYRNLGAGERREYAVLALDLMSGRQQHARRLLAQHDPSGRRLDEKRRVRLSALVLTHANPAAESIQPVGEPRVEPGDIESVRFVNLHEDRIAAIGIHRRRSVRSRCERTAPRDNAHRNYWWAV